MTPGTLIRTVLELKAKSSPFALSTSKKKGVLKKNFIFCLAPEGFYLIENHAGILLVKPCRR